MIPARRVCQVCIVQSLSVVASPVRIMKELRVEIFDGAGPRAYARCSFRRTCLAKYPTSLLNARWLRMCEVVVWRKENTPQCILKIVCVHCLCCFAFFFTARPRMFVK